MKHFMDIEVARFEADAYKEPNTYAFQQGDHIIVQEKIDGSNASVRYDAENDSLLSFSRKLPLTWNNTLNGFYNYVLERAEKPEVMSYFREHPNFVVFGEWAIGCNKIKDYPKDYLKKWVVYDIFDDENKIWLSQDAVKEFCAKTGEEYIHVLYDGEFDGWDIVKAHMHDNTYGPTQEGVVIKNESKLAENLDSRAPFYIKIVNSEFSEKMKTKVKVIDPEKEAEKAQHQSLVESVVTRRRVEKGLEKLRDAGEIPAKLTPADMKLVAKSLPKVIYDDVMKEEKEIALACGEDFCKICSALTMRFARELILG